MGGPYAGNDTSGDEAQALAFYQNQAAEKNIGNVNAAFAQYTPQWFQQRANAYTASALPQLNQQVNQEQNSLGFALANRGLQNSTAAQNQYQNLGQYATGQKQGIVNAGQQYAQQLQQQINNSKLNLYSLGGTPGMGSASTAAVDTAAGFQAPNPIAPITDYLSQFNTQLATRFALSSPPTGSPNAGIASQPWGATDYTPQQPQIPGGNSPAYTVNA